MNLKEKLEYKASELESILLSNNLSNEQIQIINDLCKETNANLETWCEIISLKNVRENNSTNIINIARNLDAISGAHDLRQVFYNVVFFYLSQNFDKSYLFDIFEFKSAQRACILYLKKQPIDQINKFILESSNRTAIPDFVFYLGVLGEHEFTPLTKFINLFDTCSLELKRRIIIGGFINSDFSFCSKLNSYFEEYRITFHTFSKEFNDDDLIIQAMVNCLSISCITYSLPAFKKIILERSEDFTSTIKQIIVRATREKTHQFIWDAACFVSKKEILSILAECDVPHVMNQFISRYSDDPEIEQFVAFA